MSGRARKPYARPEPRGEAPDGMWLHDRAPGARKPQRVVESSVVSNAAPNTKLRISNLHYEISPKDLIAIFGQMGTLVREPYIGYDRSGRSTGIAIVSFENVGQATKAKQSFDGILAKGQPMSVSFYVEPPHLRRSSSAPTTSSLLNRIAKPHLADRLSQDDSQVKRAKGESRKSEAGPVRNKRGGGGGGAAKKQPKKAKTAEELDKELDAFMVDDSTPSTEPSAVSAAPEVEMS